MKSNRLTNILLVAVLAVLLSGRLPAASPTPVQPAAAAPAALGVSSMMPNAVSGYVSVSAAAFHPTDSGLDYINDGAVLKAYNTTYYPYFTGEISLPDGATIDGLDCLMRDLYPAAIGECSLYNVDLTGTYIGFATNMGTATTNHSTSDPTLYSTTSIIDAQVDNSQHTYMIILILPYADFSNFISFGGARVHYYYDAVYLPTVSK